MSNIKQYRKKPVVIEALLFTGTNSAEAIKFIGNSVKEVEQDFLDSDLTIKTLEGDMYVSEGDYIIKGVLGEFYPCKHDIFEATYEAVDLSGEHNGSSELAQAPTSEEK